MPNFSGSLVITIIIEPKTASNTDAASVGVTSYSIIILLLYFAFYDCRVTGDIILRWVLRKLEGVVGTGWS
jgi:hypothetical protein